MPSSSEPRPGIVSRATLLVASVTQNIRDGEAHIRVLYATPTTHAQGTNSRFRRTPTALPSRTVVYVCGETSSWLVNSSSLLCCLSDRSAPVPRCHHPREQPSKSRSTSKPHPWPAMPSPPVPYPNQPGHHTVTLLCDSRVSSGKSRAQFTPHRPFRWSLVRGCGLTFNPTLRVRGERLIRMSRKPLYILSPARTWY